MLRKMKIYASNSVYFLKEKSISKLKRENGMEMLQMVLIIGIAVVIAGGFYVFLKPFLGDFWTNIEEKMGNIFNSEDELGTPL